MQTKFLKYFNFTLLFSLMCMVSAAIFITSCQKEEENTKVELFSFGPSPVARGAELRFIGVNLDKVTSVVIPNNISITTFTSKTSELLTLTVPQTAVPGYVVLKTPDGDITTKTMLGFSEPISISSFTPETIKAGQTLTINGDYLNLVGAVMFTSGVSVDSSAFLTQTRKQITLAVPPAAQTGKIAVSNGAADPVIVYSVTPLDVTLPAFTDISPNPVKAGTALTITGTDLDLVKTVVLGGPKSVTSFTSQSATQIVLTVPADTKDGVVTMIPASGVNVASEATLEMVVPTVSVNPTTIKNGGIITVTGTDLDLIDAVTFGGNKAGTIQAGGTATQITVKVPDDAVTGVVTFGTKAAKTVDGPVITMVVPTVTSIAPTSGKPNTSVTITGTDLDLVSTVTFTGGINGTITGQTATQLVVTVPVGAKTGAITLTTKNGTTITTDSYEVLSNLPNISGYAEARGEQGKILTIQGTGLLLIKELIFPGNIYATAYGEKTDTKVEVYVPVNVPTGYGQITMVTYEGEQGLLPQIYFGTVTPVYDQTLCFFDFNGNNKDSWWGNAMGSGIVTSPSTSADGTPYWNIDGTSGTGYWDGLFFRNGSDHFVTTGVTVSGWAVRFDINVRQTIYTGILKIRFGDYYYEFKPWDGVAGGYKTDGWITVTCPLTGFYNGTTQLTDPSVGGAEFGMVWASGTAVTVDMGIDNLRFEPL